MVTLNKYGEDWGEVVTHFAQNELKSDVGLTLEDLHNRLCAAYADFPISTPALQVFLRALGFSYRLDGSKSYIVFETCGEREENMSCEASEEREENVHFL